MQKCIMSQVNNACNSTCIGQIVSVLIASPMHGCGKLSVTTYTNHVWCWKLNNKYIYIGTYVQFTQSNLCIMQHRKSCIAVILHFTCTLNSLYVGHTAYTISQPLFDLYGPSLRHAIYTQITLSHLHCKYQFLYIEGQKYS